VPADTEQPAFHFFYRVMLSDSFCVKGPENFIYNVLKISFTVSWS